ncbi:phospholipase C, phosphocholine-specific [Niabella terrae]
MKELNRRKFIGMTAKAGVGVALWEPLLQKALAVPAYNRSRTINDVQHIVILMQENRSFDHYFGAMRGVRGFGDRFPIPLKSGQRAFHQSDGKKIVPPYRANGKTSNAALVQGTPHNFSDMQAAWNQGKYGFWPLYKTPYSMAYYTREEIPFQYAMAESFTICDAHFCSVATGTDPNRIVFFSGANFDPDKRAAGINCTDRDSEPVNLRCWIKGGLPEPGYQYQGDAFRWATLPDLLERAGLGWRIYQDPNDNWTGAMHGCLAFDSFRKAKPGSAIYENGMRHWSLEDLKNDVLKGKLPEVSWVLPSQKDSEHPGAPSSPYRAADFTHRILEAITANPEVWSKTVFFVTFDENDGFFDHLPAPAVPSYNLDGSLAGKSTVDIKGMYFNNSGSQKNYIDPRDTISGQLRPWGMGPRVPMYIISPWSKGGWVNSEVADHTSVAQFIEKRFGIEVPSITPWHRAVSSDLSSAFDFETPNVQLPPMPDTADFATRDARSKQLPKAVAPQEPADLFQEKGSRRSRALPYQLETHCTVAHDANQVSLHFINSGSAGVVFHVYNLLDLDAIPRRYTVETGKSLEDDWNLPQSGDYDLEIYGPNGFFRKFRGQAAKDNIRLMPILDRKTGRIELEIKNTGNNILELNISDNAYQYGTKTGFRIRAGKTRKLNWQLKPSGYWYDFSVVSASGYQYRMAGRLETGRHSISDPAMAADLINT